MASSNQTQTYKLAQWLEDDPVLREDFNADNLKIETALKSLQTAVNESKPVIGVYTGTGINNGQSINLGFQPKAVFVSSWVIRDGMTAYTGIANSYANAGNLVITSNGFQVYAYLNGTDANLNSPGNPYRYVAFRA